MGRTRPRFADRTRRFIGAKNKRHSPPLCDGAAAVFFQPLRALLLRRFPADGAGDVGGRIAEREQGANQQIQSDRAVAFFHLREPRLAGADFARQFALRQIALGALLPQAPTASEHGTIFISNPI